MSSGRYAPLPNPSSSSRGREADELEAAFELNDDDDEDNNHTPTVVSHHRQQQNNSVDRRAAPQQHSRGLSIRTSGYTSSPPAAGGGGGYDFERQDYDFPPPGSPPAPTSTALPNDFGNSNGVVPSSPIQPPQPSFFRRALGAVLPAQYTRVATSEGAGQRAVGGGTENDGVFANVMAKPQVGRVVTAEDGNVYVVPEESQKEMPPTYAEAQADAVPPYWETTIHAPASLDPSDPHASMIIDDLPTGAPLTFAMNFLISWFFQFVGFFLTYMLHTSHAAKYGSRAGLGMTLIQYGVYSRAGREEQEREGGGGGYGRPGWWPPANGTMGMGMGDGEAAQESAPQTNELSQGSKDWLSFLFMTLGWFLLLSSCVGYWRVKRWESSLRAPPPPADPTSPEEIERDQAIRRNIHNVFGLRVNDGRDEGEGPVDLSELTPAQRAAIAAEARLTRDLRAAGLI